MREGRRALVARSGRWRPARPVLRLGCLGIGARRAGRLWRTAPPLSRTLRVTWPALLSERRDLRRATHRLVVLTPATHAATSAMAASPVGAAALAQRRASTIRVERFRLYERRRELETRRELALVRRDSRHHAHRIEERLTSVRELVLRRLGRTEPAAGVLSPPMVAQLPPTAAQPTLPRTDSWPEEPAPFPPPRPSPAARRPPALDFEQVTDEVLQRIERRAIAQLERTGGG